jgi:hypothetical protein
VDARGLCGTAVFSATTGCKDSLQAQERYSSMEKKIAEETGGRAYLNTNGPGAILGEIVSNDSSYYSLGYAPHPQRSAPGFRKVDVRLDQARYQLVYRHVYFDPGNSGGHVAGSISPIQSALLPGIPPSTQILFEARLQPLDPAIQDSLAGSSASATVGGPKVHRYRLDLSIDPHSLTFDQGSDGNRSIDLRCAAMVYDANGRSVSFTTNGIRLRVPDGQYTRLMAAETTTSIPLHLTLNLAAGMLTLRAVIYGATTLQTGSVEIPLVVRGD